MSNNAHYGILCTPSASPITATPAIANINSDSDFFLKVQKQPCQLGNWLDPRYCPSLEAEAEF